MKKLYGVTTAMTMPFAADGGMNMAALAEHVDFLIERGVHCLYPMGTTGEMLKMTLEERMAVAEAVVAAARGRCVVYIHVGAMRTEDAVALARHAHGIGADGVGAVTPMFFGANEQELFGYYAAISRALPDDYPLYLYAIPQCACNDITPALAERLHRELPNVVGIKHSGPDFTKTYDYLAIGDGFDVMQGNDRMFLPALSMGCQGVVSGMSSAFPELFVAIYDAYQVGDIYGANRIQLLANAVVKTLKAGASSAYMKEALRQRGLPEMHMRAPQTALDPQAQEALARELQAFWADPLFQSIVRG